MAADWLAPMKDTMQGCYDDGYRAGRIAALREACERTCPHGTLIGETCGQTFTDGMGKRHARARCTLHLMLAEAESGEDTGERA